MVVPQGKYNDSEVAMLDYKSVMDTFFEKGDPKLLVDEIHRRQIAYSGMPSIFTLMLSQCASVCNGLQFFSQSDF